MNTIKGRLVIVLLAIHAVLLPLTYVETLTAVETELQEALIDHARIYGRMLADIFEGPQSPETDEEILHLLDSAVLGGRSIYAAVRIGDVELVSPLSDPVGADRFAEDFEFGAHADDIYYLSVPIEFRGPDTVLRLGIDESPTLQYIANIRQALLTIIAVYLLGTVLLAVAFSEVLARPLKRLQTDSREIAGGNYGHELGVASRIREIQELARDLESMRRQIVGANKQLQREITDRKAAEAQRRQLEARLQVLQRIESVGTLAGGVAHEFNNVLQPLLLYADLALDDVPDDSPARPYLERIISLAQRGKNLSHQILTFGRESPGAALVATDIAPVIEEAMSMVRAVIPANIEIRTEIDHASGDVLCNPAEVQQLLVNLCINAYNAVQAGGGHFTVRLGRVGVTREFAGQHPGLKAGRYVRLQVEDTGEGMDESVLARIFEPFFTTRDVGQGSGLGMSVVHGIVTKHDGGIIVSSEPKVGTIVSVYLPAAGADETLIAKGKEV